MLEVLARIRHRRTRRQLSPYLDGMLSERENRRLEAHLARCRACRDELADLQVAVQALAELPLVESPRSFALTAAPRRVEALRPAPRRVEFGLRLATAAAAFVLAIVAAGDLLGVPGGDEGQEGEANVARMQVAPREAATAQEMEPAPQAETPGVAAQDKVAGEAPTAPAPVLGAGQAMASPAAGMGGVEEGTPSLGAPVPAPTAPPETFAPGVGEPATPAATATAAATAAPAATASATETPPPTGTPVPAEGQSSVFGPAGTPEVGSPAATQETPAATGTPPPMGAQIAPSEPEQTPSGAENQALAEADRGSLAAEGGGPSRETVLRWLEIGLATGVALLFVSWLLARRRGQA